MRQDLERGEEELHLVEAVKHHYLSLAKSLV
jgi:hypothetical protein